MICSLYRKRTKIEKHVRHFSLQDMTKMYSIVLLGLFPGKKCKHKCSRATKFGKHIYTFYKIRETLMICVMCSFLIPLILTVTGMLLRNCNHGVAVASSANAASDTKNGGDHVAAAAVAERTNYYSKYKKKDCMQQQ
jgi:hypothetical protein